MTQHIVIPSPIGNIYIAGSENGISRIQLLVDAPVSAYEEIPSFLKDCVTQLNE